MKAHEDERLHRLLRASLAPTMDAAASRDLWPDVLAGLDQRPAFRGWTRGSSPLLLRSGCCCRSPSCW